MVIPVTFTKMSGAGNDFVVINNYDGRLDVEWSRFAEQICDRHFGVGADGLLVVGSSSVADFKMEYYNADGSYGGMCGNGGRCIARYTHLLNSTDGKMQFEALDTIYRAEVKESVVRLRMKPINRSSINRLTLDVIGCEKLFFVDSGSPHAICECTDLMSVDVAGLGSMLRYHKEFRPDGCNVNFVECNIRENQLLIRTYERGVEAETLACGTGSVASAIAFAELYGLASPVSLRVRSNEVLRVYFERTNERFNEIWLEGSAHVHFSGVFHYDLATNLLVDSVIDASNNLSRDP